MASFEQDDSQLAIRRFILKPLLSGGLLGLLLAGLSMGMATISQAQTDLWWKLGLLSVCLSLVVVITAPIAGRYVRRASSYEFLRASVIMTIVPPVWGMGYLLFHSYQLGNIALVVALAVGSGVITVVLSYLDTRRNFRESLNELEAHGNLDARYGLWVLSVPLKFRTTNRRFNQGPVDISVAIRWVIAFAPLVAQIAVRTGYGPSILAGVSFVIGNVLLLAVGSELAVGNSLVDIEGKLNKQLHIALTANSVDLQRSSKRK